MEKRGLLKDIIKAIAKLIILLYLVGVVFTAIGYGIYLLNIEELSLEAYKFITDICSTPLGMVFVMPTIVVLCGVIVILCVIVGVFLAALFTLSLNNSFINPQDIIDRQRSIKGE